MSLQDYFDATYISSTEICQQLGVTRSTVSNGVKARKLPDPIIIRRSNGEPHILLWLREEAEPMMQEWAKAIASRKGQ